MKAVTELERFGYRFRIVGDDIHFTLTGDRPNPTEVSPLMAALRNNKEEALPFLRARLAAEVNERIGLERVAVVGTEALPGGTARPDPARGWLHLWKADLHDLARRRDELIAVRDRGVKSLDRIGSVYGASSAQFIKATERWDRLNRTLERLDCALAQVAADFHVTERRIRQIAEQEKARQKEPDRVDTPGFPKKWFRCLVIDPPWQVEKIERDVRPKQGKQLDYATVTLEEIEALPIRGLANSKGCHLYLWVTHKFLPAALKLLEAWGFDYQCVMTWVKPTGLTPFSWM